MQEPFRILFNKDGKPIDAQRIRHLVSAFSKSYDSTVKIIIDHSIILDKDTFRFNVASLMPSFNMTRRGAFHGLKIANGTIEDPNHVLDTCWTQVDTELRDLKKHVTGNTSCQKSRVILELSPKSRDYVVMKASELFDKLKWTTVNGSRVGRVGASKILFAVLPEIALPVDNREWDYVFRTDNYGKILSIMIDEVNKWERNSKIPFETLDSHLTKTVPSIYNVMAMHARPPPANAKTR